MTFSRVAVAITAIAMNFASLPALAGETVDVTILGMTCENCEKKVTGYLNDVDGISDTEIDHKTALASFEADELDRDALRAMLAEHGYDIYFAGETPITSLSEEELAALDFSIITHGDKFNLKDHLADGKFTVVDFYAPWCAPCKVLSPKLEHLIASRSDVALRKVDIVDWKSKAAAIAMDDHGVAGLPFVIVFGPDGKKLGHVQGNLYAEIEALIPAPAESTDEAAAH